MQRAPLPHPNSLASLLSSWHLTESPVKDKSRPPKPLFNYALDAEDFDLVLRPKDLPRSIILDRELIPSTWASFTSFLERNALPSYYADSSLLSSPDVPSTFLGRIWDLRESWQRELVSKDSDGAFHWSSVRGITVAWVRALDLVLPARVRAGQAAQGVGLAVKKRQADAQGDEVLYRTRADGVFYKQGSILIVVGNEHPQASWPPDSQVPPVEDKSEDGVYRRLINCFLDKNTVLTGREFFELTSQWDKEVFALLSKIVVACVSRSCRYFVLNDPLNMILGVLVPINDPHEEIGKSDFDVLLSPLIPLTSATPPIPQLLAGLYYDQTTLQMLHSDHVEALVLQHDRQAAVESGTAHAPAGPTGRQTHGMLRVAPAKSTPRLRSSVEEGRQAVDLAQLSQSSTFFLVYPDGAMPNNPLLRRIPIPLVAPSETEISPGEEIPLILHIYEWIGSGAASHVYQALTVGPEEASYAIKVARRTPDNEFVSFVREATLLERLKDAAWVCHVYACLEGADRKCPSVLLMEYGGEAIENWDELSRDERLELYWNVVTLHPQYNLLHDDLRPQNVVVDPPPFETLPENLKRRVRLIDFVWALEHQCEGEDTCAELQVFRRDLGL
ncbi:hypothetical protein NBRC10512_007845 [Rhodotorula toruloides]|uniref:RHTO0S02e15698g1_1 n=2 Tax=Rhodotorula toruloides TaxID=5286 RepID=A0A061AK61_RHOTO|nr:protein tyrosine kinase, transcription regulator [Rhodotorula toruloides NP11]EMS23351.1 protein tyrosine kinase, transcription regulator [Rhodotorula toruloides NP11]CDR37505.1 RHTO0S02e15698g1_1 [Rhodotorula toruloides]